jgi:hypothetical protein
MPIFLFCSLQKKELNEKVKSIFHSFCLHSLHNLRLNKMSYQYIVSHQKNRTNRWYINHYEYNKIFQNIGRRKIWNFRSFFLN